MADEKQVKPRGGCFGKLVVLITLAGVAGLGAAVFFIAQPQDLADLKGGAPGLAAATGPDLRAVLEKAIEGNYPVTLTEEQVNRYVRQTLDAKQGGLLGGFVSFEGVRIRLQEGRAEVIMERSVMDHPVTLSMYLTVEQFIDVQGRPTKAVVLGAEPYFPEVPRMAHLIRGGRFGRLEVPQGFLILVRQSFANLAAVYAKELDLGFDEMSRITFSDGKIVLDPRADGGSPLSGSEGTY